MKNLIRNTKTLNVDESKIELYKTAKILPNGLIKYFDSFGNYERLGFYFKNAEIILKNEGYEVIR